MDFVIRSSLSPLSPALSEPTIVIAPMQKRSEAVIKPCATEPFSESFFILFSIKSPSFSILPSMSAAVPIIVPKTIDKISTIVFSPSSAPSMPIYSVQSPIAVIADFVILSGIPFFKSSPKLLPIITVATFISTPSKNIHLRMQEFSSILAYMTQFVNNNTRKSSNFKE